jgi:hypothetical protein
MPLDTTDANVAFGIPLVSMLMSMPMMWCEEHLWNFSVLQRVHLSNLVYKLEIPKNNISSTTFVEVETCAIGK